MDFCATKIDEPLIHIRQKKKKTKHQHQQQQQKKYIKLHNVIIRAFRISKRHQFASLLLPHIANACLIHKQQRKSEIENDGARERKKERCFFFFSRLFVETEREQYVL